MSKSDHLTKSAPALDYRQTHRHLPQRALVLPAETELYHVTRIFQALSDFTRAKVIFAMTQGERSVNEIAAAVNASPSAVSHHLRRLRDAGLVAFHRHGNQVFYSIENIHICTILEEAQHHTDHTQFSASQRAKQK